MDNYNIYRQNPAAGGNANKLVVFLHGYGADGKDLIDLANPFGMALPNASFISPDAPNPCAMSPQGRQWFPIEEIPKGAIKASLGLLNLIENEAEKLNLDFQEFTSAGFMLGHASVVSIPKDFSMTEYIHHLFEFSAEESCGKCFPGRLGSYRGKEMFDQAKKKTAKIPLKLLNELLITMQKGCLCALCGAIPTPIMNILKYFGDEMKSDMVKDN